MRGQCAGILRAGPLGGRKPVARPHTTKQATRALKDERLCSKPPSTPGRRRRGSLGRPSGGRKGMSHVGPDTVTRFSFPRRMFARKRTNAPARVRLGTNLCSRGIADLMEGSVSPLSTASQRRFATHQKLATFRGASTPRSAAGLRWVLPRLCHDDGSDRTARRLGD